MSNNQLFKDIKYKKKKLNQNSKKNNKYYFLLVAVFILTISVYSNSIKNDFINYDDNEYVSDNNYIKDCSPKGIYSICKSYFKDELPVTLLSFAVDYKLWKLNPKPYHVENIIFHLLNILLVFILIKKLSNKIEVAFITALLFAVHPFRTESVVWIAERKDMLFGLFYLCSLIFYITYIKSGKKLRFVFFSFIFASLSLLSKFSAVTLPVVLFLIDYYYSKQLSFKSVIEKIPFFILPLVSGIIHFSTSQSTQLVGKYFISYNFFDSIIFASYSLFFYLNKFLFPVNLSILHAYPNKSNGFLPYEYYICFALIIILITLIIFLIIKIKKIKKELIFGFLFFLISISIVLQIIPFGGWVVVAERYTYIPYLGLFFIIGQIYYLIVNNNFSNFKYIKSLFYGILLVYISFASILTYYRNKTWENSISIFNDVIRKDSTAFFAYNYRGLAKFKKGDIEGSLGDFNKAIEINPYFLVAFVNRGNLMNEIRNFPIAIEDFNHVINSCYAKLTIVC